jgi:hypothetical protein
MTSDFDVQRSMEVMIYLLSIFLKMACFIRRHSQSLKRAFGLVLDNFKFWFWQILVNLTKCAKFHLNLSRCLQGAGQACADLPFYTAEKIKI